MIKLTYNYEDLAKPLDEVFSEEPQKWNYMLNLKSLIGSAFSNLERLFKGCFGQGLDLECSDLQYGVFTRVFPVIGRILETMDGRESMTSFCRKLLYIRNACMHAHSFLSPETIVMDRRFIEALPNYGAHTYVDTDGKLTLAGLLAILLCMANKEMVQNMASSGLYLLMSKIGLYEGYENARDKAFSETLETQLGTDLEAEIRTQTGDEPMAALWGEYLPKVKRSDCDFEYMDSRTIEDSIHVVRGSIKDEDGRLVLRIKAGSFYNLYFPNEYELVIEDVAYFVELANKVPPFMLVPFLCRLGIGRLYRGVLTEKQEELCGKLNQAKFYADKSVNILMLGDSVSDQRTMSQGALPQVLYCFLNLEYNIYRLHGDEIKTGKSYSTLAEGLKAIGIDQPLIDEAVALRNFFAHGFILGDYYGRTKTTYRKFELQTMIRLFRRLVEAIVMTEPLPGNRLMGDVAGRLAEQLADVKYKKYAEKWDQIIKAHRPWNDQLAKPMGRINNSYLTAELEEELAFFFYEKKHHRYTVLDILVRPEMVLKCNGKPIGMDEVKIVRLKRGVDLYDVFGPIGRDGFVVIESRKNPLVRYKRLELKQ